MKPMSGFGRFLFWDYPRASWQYDVMVGLILVFVFVAPRYVNFRDQPKPASIVMLPADGGAIYHLETRLLAGVAATDRAGKATELVNARYKSHVEILRVEPIVDAEDETIGYAAFAEK